jgi:GAF domain-containing protein
VATAAASVLAFDFFHTPPLYSITLNTPEDHTAVSAFLVVGLMTTTLAGLARSRAALAEQRNQLAEVTAERARVLAEQQAALRRVAILVATGSSPSEVFGAVAEEMVRCVNCGNASVSRLDGDRVTFVAFAGLDPERTPLPVVGECFSLDDDVIVAEVLRTGQPVRMDCYEKATGAVAARIRERGLNSVVAAPIVVDSRIWGLAGVASVEPLPPETEERISDFADLVATALANAATRDELIATRDELIASRARIVAAADDARRRIERDLHDGAQQRLVH